MIAYNITGLDNLAIQREVQDAFDNNSVSAEELQAVKKQYPTNLYTPNLFIRIALFIATNIIGSFLLGFLSLPLLAVDTSVNGFGVLCIFFSMLTYAALEWMVRRFRHYKSGVDDAVIWISASFMVSGINIIGNGNISWLANAVLVLMISAYLLHRFPGRLLSIIACVALFAVVFLAYIRLGSFAKATTPFLLMLVTALVYFFARNKIRQPQWKYYKQCMSMVTITALVCFYAAANYFVVRESSNAMFGLQLREGESIPYGWIFWILTVLVPFVYIIGGIRKKDVVLLRTGLLLIVFTVFNVRYYYSVLPIESAMVIGGVIMIGLAWSFIQYLKTPKFGFTYLPVASNNLTDNLNIEALVIAQTFTPQIPVTGGTTFGGGSGGGAGASGEF
jgi:hypothetical protein